MNRLLHGMIQVIQEIDTNTALPICNDHTCPTMSAGRSVLSSISPNDPTNRQQTDIHLARKRPAGQNSSTILHYPRAKMDSRQNPRPQHLPHRPSARRLQHRFRLWRHQPTGTHAHDLSNLHSHGPLDSPLFLPYQLQHNPDQPFNSRPKRLDR